MWKSLTNFDPRGGVDGVIPKKKRKWIRGVGWGGHPMKSHRSFLIMTPVSDVLRHSPTPPSPLSLIGEGLSVTLRCVKPSANAFIFVFYALSTFKPIDSLTLFTTIFVVVVVWSCAAQRIG